jgi:tRNA-specific 2-thiouridylase
LLSGGVDSAFAALELKASGHEVEGFTAVFRDGGRAPGAEGAARAEALCRALSIPHSVVDLRAEFAHSVLVPFASAYAGGLTPNPCARCNRFLKLGELARIIRGRGFDWVATGHYARLAEVRGRVFLREPRDRRKSQVYFLSLVDPGDLERLKLPLADFRKEEVRSRVKQAGLAVRAGESQDLCFIARGRYVDFIRASGLDPGRGNVIDMEGGVLTTHKGHTAYTVGQRFGFRGKRYYVIEKRPRSNEIVIGERSQALRTRITAGGLNLFLPVSEMTGKIKVRYRYNSAPVEATVEELGPDTVTVLTRTPCFAPAPGQVLAGYEAGRLVFGGIIERAA